MSTKFSAEQVSNYLGGGGRLTSTGQVIKLVWCFRAAVERQAQYRQMDSQKSIKRLVFFSHESEINDVQ